MQFSEFIVQQIEHFVSVFRIYSFRHQRMCFSSVFFFMSSFFVMWCKYERWSFLFASIFRHWLNGESIGLQPISNVLLLLLLLLFSGITMYYVVTIDNPKVSQLVEWLLRFECLKKKKTVTDVQLKIWISVCRTFSFHQDEWWMKWTFRPRMKSVADTQVHSLQCEQLECNTIHNHRNSSFSLFSYWRYSIED